MILFLGAAILSFWAGTALVWWHMEPRWGNGEPMPAAFRLFRSMDWLPSFLRLPDWGHVRYRLHDWLVRRCIDGKNR